MDFKRASEIFSAYLARSVDAHIDADDAMYRAGPDWYLPVGKSALQIVLQALLLSWKDEPRRLLDLPCGHGRAARHFRAAFPAAELFFCDIDKAGADFCANRFNGRPVYSTPDLLTLALPEALDVIWVGSLFTHLDRERTERWLEFLARHLSAHGVLVATFHGLFSLDNHSRQPLFDAPRFEKIAEEFKKTGYGYASYSKNEVTAAEKINDDYGISISHPATIIEMASRIPDTRILGYCERGWANNHDVLILTRNNRLTPF